MGRIVTAEYRSRQFLLEHLNWWQRFTFRRFGWFRVKGNYTGRRYRISDHDITQFPWSFCLVFIRHYDYRLGYEETIRYEETIPVADAMLAKKILITADERLFLSTAKKR